MALGMGLLISYPDKTQTINRSTSINKWDRVFKNGTRKICGRQSLKILLGQFLNILSLIHQQFISHEVDENQSFNDSKVSSPNYA